MPLDPQTRRGTSPEIDHQSRRRVIAAHAYPSDLATLVLRRWHEARDAGHTTLPPPDVTQLTDVLSICYQATLLREEGRLVTFRLALSDPDAFEPAAGPPSGLHRLVFTRRLPLDQHELRRLAPATLFSAVHRFEYSDLR
jgi:hypothetical protein